MLPFLNSERLVAAIKGEAASPQTRDADHAHYLATTLPPMRVPLMLRWLPRAIRQPILARMTARRQEQDLIHLWEVSPHLLRDVGMVLNASGDLPDHLVAAPDRVIEHVAQRAPDQIVAAELEFPPAGAAGAAQQLAPAAAPASAPARTARADLGTAA